MRARSRVFLLVGRILTAGYVGFLAWMSLGTKYPRELNWLLRVLGTRVLHFGAYAVLAILLAWTLPVGRRHRLWVAVMAAFAVGAALDLLQLVAPGRTMSVLDMGINLGGAVLGGLAFWVGGRARRAR